MTAAKINKLAIGSVIYYAGYDIAHGVELWKTDGTAAGTMMVKDIHPGATGSSPSSFASMGGLLYFVANDGVHGAELWRSDGTDVGTYMVSDIYPGSNSSNISGGLNVLPSGVLIFSATDGVNTQNAWRSDGTAAGTYPLGNLFPAIDPIGFTVVGNKVFFTVYNLGNQDLGVTDGTTAGTRVILVGGVSNTSPEYFINLGGVCYFLPYFSPDSNLLWKSDGTAAGTVGVSDLGGAQYVSGGLQLMNGKLIINAINIATYQIWVSDGTGAGTILLRNNASMDAGPYDFSGFSLMFVTDKATPHGSVLWKTDGTPGGTAELKDMNPGVTTDKPSDVSSTAEGSRILVVGTKLFFGYNDQINGDQLWVSDGTNAGTQMVKKHTDQSLTSDLDQFKPIRSQLLFTAQTNLGAELWISDGTSGGTNLVKDILPGAASSQPNNMIILGSKVFFTATNPAGGVPTVFVTDGTSAGTVGFAQAQVVARGTTAATSLSFFNNQIYFGGTDHAYGQQIWKTDSTYSGRNLNASLVADLFPNGGCSAPTAFTIFNSSLFFAASDATHGTELFYSDGTTSGTQILKDIYPGTGGSVTTSVLSSSVQVNGKLFFVASDPVNGSELWVSDGTSAGTQLVKDINPGASDSSPGYLTAFGNQVIFNASTAANGSEPWISDGTAAGTMMIKDINPGATGSVPYGFTVMGSLAVFPASDGVHGYEPWVTDGTAAGTFMLKDMVAGAGDSIPGNFVALGSSIIFTSNSASGTELQITDGTTAGTQILKDIYPGASSSNPSHLTLVGNKIFFSATDNVNGTELWVTDGTAAGTTLVKDINPGIVGSNPVPLLAWGNQLVFLANETANGNQLWITDGTPAGTTRLTLLNTSANGISVSSTNMIIYKNQLYLQLNDGTNGAKLWTSDGTAAGTVMYKDNLPGAGSSNPSKFMIGNGHLYYLATTPDRGNQLFMIE